jgi:UDP-2,3-diacylglucosamine hydrolase
MPAPIGLIAGEGQLPVMTARGMRAAGRRVACVGLADQFLPELPALCDDFSQAGVVRLGRWIKLLRRWGVSEAVMVGRVRKTRMYDPLRAFRQLPDWRAAWLWYRVLRHDRRTDTVLRAVADELQKNGITLIDSTTFIPEHLAHAGTMTRRQPTAAQTGDIAFGLPLVRQMGLMDIGQAIAVKEREVIAVEAMEGTDRMIARAGELCRSGGWTLIKVAKPQQDLRFDVPTIGPQTIEKLHAAGGTCLAVEATKVILINKPDLIQTADRLGVCLVGIV